MFNYAHTLASVVLDFDVIVFVFFFLNALQSDNNCRTAYVLGHKLYCFQYHKTSVGKTKLQS